MVTICDKGSVRVNITELMTGGVVLEVHCYSSPGSINKEMLEIHRKLRDGEHNLEVGEDNDGIIKIINIIISSTQFLMEKISDISWTQSSGNNFKIYLKQT